MHGLKRVTFRFGNDLEVRYLPDVPHQGDFVTRGDELWKARFVSADRVGMTVVCVLRNGDDRAARHAA
jgi:hypothetical protein